MCPLLGKARQPKTMAVNPASAAVHSTMVNADTVPSAMPMKKNATPTSATMTAPYDAKKYHGDFPDSRCLPVWLNGTDE